MLTSQYKRVHGQTGNVVNMNMTTLQRVLGDAGYVTGGLTSCDSLSRKFGFGYDFTYLNDSLRGSSSVLNASIEFIEKNRDGKFFLFIHDYDVHYPYVRDNPYREDYGLDCLDGKNMSKTTYMRRVRDIEKSRNATERERGCVNDFYDNCLSSVDSHFGQLIEFLRTGGLMNNTIIIVTSDHGEGLFEHWVELQHSFYLYDEDIRVPLVVYNPKISGNQKIEQQVQTLDIMPTILDFLGVPVPATVQGLSLSELILRGQYPTNYSFTEAIGKNRVSVRTEEWKLMYNLRTGGGELYDLVNDPGESKNLVHEMPQKVREMGDVLFGWREYNDNMSDILYRKATYENITLDNETREKLRELGYMF